MGAQTLTVWVPPGAALLTSPGVDVRTIPVTRPAEPDLKASEPAPESGPALAIKIPRSPDRPKPDSGRRSKSDAGRRTEPSSSVWEWAGRIRPRTPEQWERDGLPERWAGAASAGAWQASEFLTVPPELEEMAQRANALYDMKVSGMTVMATKPEKGGAIWKIETNKGPRSLKVLHRPPERSLFSVAAQEYLVERGARVPALIRNKEGAYYCVLDGKMWIVTDWIEQLVPATKDLAGAQALCYGLGEFHKLSRGYEPPPGAAIASRLRRWPKTYRKMLNKMDWFRIVAQAYPEMPASASVLSIVDMFEQQAREALERLERSAYAELVARGDSAWGLAHQDKGSNSTKPRSTWKVGGTLNTIDLQRSPNIGQHFNGCCLQSVLLA